jgi:hypothetical protein
VRFSEPNGEIEIVPVDLIIERQADRPVHHIKQIESIISKNSVLIIASPRGEVAWPGGSKI